MTTSPAEEESAIIATYSTRRDAEVARDYLSDAEIQTFVSSDDAGGMHPQMQRPNGVKLIGMSGTAHEARTVLKEADLLPNDDADPEAPDNEAPTAKDVRSSPSGWVFTGVAITIVVLVILGMLLLGSV